MVGTHFLHGGLQGRLKVTSVPLGSPVAKDKIVDGCDETNTVFRFIQSRQVICGVLKAKPRFG